MATKGLMRPYYAIYKASGDTVTYSDGGIAGHAISYSLSAERGDNVDLYADNEIVETDFGKFKSGTLTLNTDNLSDEISKALLGCKGVTRQVGDNSVTELVWDDDQTPVEVGFGVIETKQVSGVNKYRAVVLARVAFSLNSEEATTKGETVEWQTPTIEGKVMRSEQVDSNYKHPWKFEATFDSLASAEAYIKAVLIIA